MELAQWFDYLRENDVYDNTRIILVSDHGYELWQMSELIYAADENFAWDLESFVPLLMVKDFNSSGFTVDNSFMTNADVPTLAMQDTIDNPINPFTGNKITNEARSRGKQFVLTGTDFRSGELDATGFLPSTWFTVSDNIWDLNNWNIYPEISAIPIE